MRCNVVVMNEECNDLTMYSRGYIQFVTLQFVT